MLDMRRYLLTMADLRRSSAKKCRPATLYPGTCDVMAPDLRHQSLRPAVAALSSIALVLGWDKNAVKCAWSVLLDRALDQVQPLLFVWQYYIFAKPNIQ